MRRSYHEMKIAFLQYIQKHPGMPYSPIGSYTGINAKLCRDLMDRFIEIGVIENLSSEKASKLKLTNKGAELLRKWNEVLQLFEET